MFRDISGGMSETLPADLETDDRFDVTIVTALGGNDLVVELRCIAGTAQLHEVHGNQLEYAFAHQLIWCAELIVGRIALSAEHGVAENGPVPVEIVAFTNAVDETIGVKLGNAALDLGEAGIDLAAVGWSANEEPQQDHEDKDEDAPGKPFAQHCNASSWLA